VTFQVPQRTANTWKKNFKAGETHPDSDKSMRNAPAQANWKGDTADSFIADYLRKNAFTIKAQPDPAVEAQWELSVDPVDPVSFFDLFLLWRAENDHLLPPQHRDAKISDSTLAKRWKFRLKQDAEGVPRLRYRSMRGENNGRV
jgi:hypothetical protein